MVGPAFQAGSKVSLSTAQLESLRGDGWACPELSGMGFHVVSAQATMHNGNPAVEIRLESNGHYATIVEEHLPADRSGTGRSTSAQLSVTQGTPPWKAVYTMPAAVISYASDLPADSADDAVPEIVRAGGVHGVNVRRRRSGSLVPEAASRPSDPTPSRRFMSGTTDKVIFVACLESTARSSYSF